MRIQDESRQEAAVGCHRVFFRCLLVVGLVVLVAPGGSGVVDGAASTAVVAHSSDGRGGVFRRRHHTRAPGRGTTQPPQQERTSSHRHPWQLSPPTLLWFPRGGGEEEYHPSHPFEEVNDAGIDKEDALSSSSSSADAALSVPDYVPAVQERDAISSQHRASSTEGGPDAPAPATATAVDGAADPSSSKADAAASAAAAAVGVKYHNAKKGNAVGDPDGEGSDSSDSDHSDWEEFEEELADAMLDPTTQVQVELELVEEEEGSQSLEEDDEDDELGSSSSSSPPPRTASGGGVGVRFSQRLGRRRNNHRTKDQQLRASNPLLGQSQHYDAWQPFVYYPPTPSALAYLKEHARAIDGASKSRLDRRTLYGCLLLEWLQVTASYRRFLDSSTSQSLQAALSMASQPQWRKAFPRHNGIRLYADDPNRGCTLAMQESIALALAHSLGAGMVILDDTTLLSIRQKLLLQGYAEDEVKPAALIRSLFSMAREGQLLQGKGSIAACMKRDLALGLDDPFDERATASCHDMGDWERQWTAPDAGNGDGKAAGAATTKALPLVVFLRVEACTGLLKSKSIMELLLQECNSPESTNLIVLGKGINAKTTSVPADPQHEGQESNDSSGRALPGPPPFGFSPHNQNASGQNDPEGSRRFNIFLARTVDAEGNGGIIGAIAPPQAGNLFPHMMAMQARERMEPESAPAKADLLRWAQQFQQHMQSNGASTSSPPPQFFNATLSSFDADNPAFANPPPQEIIQETLQQAMGELLDRLAQVNEEADGASDLGPDLQREFAQVLRNENLRRGIAENLARAAPALSDPKCQGVMLSVYVPPPPPQANRGKLPVLPGKSNMGGWFQKILNNQEGDYDPDDINAKQKRVRTMAAAAAVLAAKKAQESNNSGQAESKADRNLARIEMLCRPIVPKTPADPVRAKSWEAWINRERGAVIFRQNRRVLNEQLESHSLTLQEHVGTRGAGSALRQMLSVREIREEMPEVIKQACELEAAKSQRQQESPSEMHDKEAGLDIDITLSQLLLTDDGFVEDEALGSGEKARVTKDSKAGVQFIHPSSLESALTMVCKISPSPSGGLSVSGSNAAHRSREEILSLAQDKHERALVSQVVSPQDIGVTYDMIGGLSEVKELLRQSITYPLKFPHLYSEGIAREAVKGVLLFGPPGTGKTMLAKAVATEGGASFLSVDASSVENKWLGESEKNAKAVFTLARRLAPCVIFIDEVDSLLSSREGTSDDSAHGTLTSVKTTMMSEWDGLNSGTNGAGEAGSDRVVVIGSTNRPYDLDEAVLRRFPRRILVDLPDCETRREILEVTLAENRLDSQVNLTQIAERLDGYTGSDIKEVCREAVVQISHEQAKLLDQGFGDSREDVTQGSLQRLRPVTAEDFDKALSKLKRSVSEKGRELARVWEWNDEYGEIKKVQRNHLPHLASMYL